MADLKYWLWLTTRKGMSAARVLAVLDHFVTPERAYYADREDYEALPLPASLWQGLLDKKLEQADRILGDCDRLGLRILTLRDTEYPDRLRNIYDPPLVLYVQGRLPLMDEEVAIAMVGTRKASPYAQEMGEKLPRRLSIW